MVGGHISHHKAAYIYNANISIHMHGDIPCMGHCIYAHKEHVGKKMDTSYYMGGNYWHSFQNKDAHREGDGHISPGMENVGDPAYIVPSNSRVRSCVGFQKKNSIQQCVLLINGAYEFIVDLPWHALLSVQNQC